MSRGLATTPLRTEDVLLLAAVCLLPWFWGGVEMAAYRSAAALLVTAAAIVVWRDGAAALFPRETRRIWIPALLLGAWGAFQAVPLPASIVGALSPRAAAIQNDAFGGAGPTATTWLRSLEGKARAVVPEAPEAAMPKASAEPGPAAPAAPRRYTLSLLPSATEERTFWYFALLAAFLVVGARAANAEVAATYELAIFATFGLLAAAGLLQQATAPHSLLWIRPAPELSRPVGPYVNPDHFAGAMELGVPWMLGWVVSRATSRRSRRRTDTAQIVVIAGTALCLLAAVVAASKIGTLLIGLTGVVVVAASARGERAARIRWFAAAAGVVILAGAASFGFLGERIADFLDVNAGRIGASDRFLVWRSGAAMFRDYWLTGSGLGAFRAVFPAYMPTGESGIWAQAHSDWLELLLGGGVVAGGLVASLGVAYGLAARRAWRRARSGSRRGAVLGASLGVGSLTAHALVDFNHQIPANALLFVVVAAWAVTAGTLGGDAA